LSYKNGRLRGGREILFLSRDAKLDGSKAVRGGIPLVFPIFGQPPPQTKSTMPQHGFARNNIWTIVDGSLYDNADSAGGSFQLEFRNVSAASRGTDNPWSAEGDHEYISVKLELVVEITAEKLTTTLNVDNTGQVSFPFQALFHTYYSVDNHAALDNDQCFVQGLEGYSGYNQLTKSSMTLGSEPVTISAEVDCIHTPPEGKDAAEVIIGVGNNSTVSLHCYGLIDGVSAPISVVVWNPHIEKAAGMADFGSDQYVDMICVEPGILGHSVLDAGKRAVMKQVISS
jgi:glucose-6-phosphate 1-epimerase